MLKKKIGDKSKPGVTFTTEGSEQDDEDEQASQFLNFGFCNVTTRRLNLRNMILLDNQSTVDLFCNKRLVLNIRKVQDSMTVKGNGGLLTTNMKADIHNYGEVWFDPSAITNILSLKNVREKYRVTFDSDGGNTFIIHRPDKADLRFDLHGDGLYYHDPAGHQLSLVNMVK